MESGRHPRERQAIPITRTARTAGAKRHRPNGAVGADADAGCPAPGRSGGRVDLRLPSDLDAAGAARLGDRLVRALEAGATCIVLWVASRRAASVEAVSLVDSLGRHMARDGVWRKAELRGEGPGYEALLAAYRRGLAGHPRRSKG